MLKTLTAVCMLYGAMQCAAYADCTAEVAMTKGSDVSDVLSAKLSTKADEASKMMSEMGDIMGTGTVNEQTCTKLDALMVRAKSL
ncbi:MAG: hypothetical protein ABSA58_14690 [Acetobacteraceae bacterium]|jgi:hypothetical protein